MADASTVTGQWQPQTLVNDVQAQRFAILNLLSGMATAALVQVVSCSNSGGVSAVGTVTVQPIINQMTGKLQPAPNGQLFNVPYWRLQGGTFAMIVDPVAGDLGVVVFMSRDTSVAVGQALGKGLAAGADPMNPATQRKYDWSDGFYIGGWLNAVPKAYLQWDGANLNINVPDGDVTLTAKNVSISAANGNVGVTAKQVNMTGPVDANGATIDKNGEITDADGIVLGTHVHPGQGSLEAPSGGGPVTGEVGAPE